MKIPQNVGPIDRLIRLATGVALVAVALGGVVSAPAVYVAWVLAAVMLATGAIGFCPLYALLHVSTADNRIAFGRHSRA